jgi:hypothetical protein
MYENAEEALKTLCCWGQCSSLAVAESKRTRQHRYEPVSFHSGKCSAALVEIGEDGNEELYVEPTRFFVRGTIRRK